MDCLYVCDTDRDEYCNSSYLEILGRNRFLFRVVDDTSLTRLTNDGFIASAYTLTTKETLEDDLVYFRLYPDLQNFVDNATDHVQSFDHIDSMFISATTSLQWAIHEMRRRSAYPDKTNIRLAVIDGWRAVLGSTEMPAMGIETAWRMLNAENSSRINGKWRQKKMFARSAQEVLFFGRICPHVLLHPVDSNGIPRLIAWKELQYFLPDWYASVFRRNKETARSREVKFEIARLRVNDDEAARQAVRLAARLLEGAREYNNGHLSHQTTRQLTRQLAEKIWLWGTSKTECDTRTEMLIRSQLTG